jgi:putative flippase GtrA
MVRRLLSLGSPRLGAYAVPMPFAPMSRLKPKHIALISELFRFGVVGTLGFIVDTATLYVALGLGAGLYLGRILSYLTAATTTWAVNRAWTFRHADKADKGRQWAMFLLVNLSGFAVNYGTYSILVSNWALAAAYPVLGVAAGSIAGLGGNFLLSRRFVFKPPSKSVNFSETM